VQADASSTAPDRTEPRSTARRAVRRSVTGS
jgi:hypothetical protein